MSDNHLKMDRKRWRSVRLQVLERDGWRCRKCGRYGKIEVDHVKPIKRGGAVYAMENLQCLCRGCHIQKTKVENMAEFRQEWVLTVLEEVANAERTELCRTDCSLGRKN